MPKIEISQNCGCFFVKTSTIRGKLSFSVTENGTIRKWPVFESDSKHLATMVGVICLNSQPIAIDRCFGIPNRLKSSDQEIIRAFVEKLIPKLESGLIKKTITAKVKIEVQYFGVAPEVQDLVEAAYPKDGSTVKIKKLEVTCE